MRRPLYSFAIDPELRDALRRVKDRDGVAESEQIRRALRLWFRKQGVDVKAPRPRAATRRRS
jgi:hypothetical protein